jgi:hypothetical protein
MPWVAETADNAARHRYGEVTIFRGALNQLPELYCAWHRDPTSFPVQYLGAMAVRPRSFADAQTATGLIDAHQRGAQHLVALIGLDDRAVGNLTVILHLVAVDVRSAAAGVQ